MDSTLRSRPTATTNPKEPTEDTSTSSPPTREYNLSSTTDNDERISRLPSLLDILRLLLLGILLSTTLSYFITSESLTWNYRPPWTRPARIRAWFVCVSPFLLLLPHIPLQKPSNLHTHLPNLANNNISARSHPPNTHPTIPLQRHHPHLPHLPRSQRLHLRRHLLPAPLRPRWPLPFLLRPRRHARFHHGMLC